MRTLCLILAFGFVLAGNTLAGSPDGDVPGIGTFQYGGSPLAGSVAHPLAVAERH